MKTALICVLSISILGVPALRAQEKHQAPLTKEQAAQTHKTIKPEEFDKLRKADPKNTVVLDVRTKGEHSEGHIAGSVLLDISSDDFEKELAKLDKNKTYLVHCAAGGRGSRACRKMNELGFKKLYNLEGGLRAWEKAGKPVEKK